MSDLNKLNYPHAIEVPSLDLYLLAYREDEQDYRNENGGKPFPSWLVTDGGYGGSPDYIRTPEKTQEFMENKVKSDLLEAITKRKNELASLKKDLDLFNKEGLSPFEIE